MKELPTLAFDYPKGADPEELMCREWLVTNGLGGYASGSIAGVNTRRYHGVFVPSLPAPHGRINLLPKLMEEVSSGAERFRLDGDEHNGGGLHVPAAQTLRRFQLEGLVPRWEFQLGETRFTRRVVMVHNENTLFVEWRNVSGPAVTLRLRPFPTFRFHDRPIPPEGDRPKVILDGARVELLCERSGAAPLLMKVLHDGIVPFVGLPQRSGTLFYRIEHRRGLDCTEELFSPGYFELVLQPGETAYLGLSVDEWASVEQDPAQFFELEAERERKLLERAPENLHQGPAARLVLAADQFLITPAQRPADAAWAKAIGQDVRSVIAGYHWFTDWGRDTMISLDGLALHTGRVREAEAILRTFQHYVRDGLLPNLFPEGGREGLYHTADATLWFFHAIDRYFRATHDEALMKDALPTLEAIVEAHLRGTRFGIRIDPADGLLTQGEEGYQLTWMDAKVDGWVVTPRRGKAVELNALWFNAVSLMAEWMTLFGQDCVRFREHARRAQQSFNARFWNDEAKCLFDVVDTPAGTNDPAIRPNQIFAISLQHPVLERARWDAVLKKVDTELLTPVGLRTLDRKNPEYKAKYDGDLRARDAAYHQGTVWPWLLGHYAQAHLKVDGDKARVRSLIKGLVEHLEDAGVGQVSEIFDATPPYRARGCVAQAWSVAELLRAWQMTQP